MKMLIHINDSAEKWLKSANTKEKVFDVIIQEKFIDV